METLLNQRKLGDTFESAKTQMETLLNQRKMVTLLNSTNSDGDTFESEKTEMETLLNQRKLKWRHF